MTFGSKNKLIEIYKKMSKNSNEIVKILTKKIFAPFENENGWAEPFISQLILFEFGFEGELLLINNYNKSSYAPKEVFNRTIDFKEFINILKKHFLNKNSIPIILDDSFVSVCVIGIKIDEKNKNIDLIIMDPHSSNVPEIGLYIVKLDYDGNKIELIPNKNVLVSENVYFCNKSWMVFIPNVNN